MPNNGEKCVNTSTIRKFGAQNFRLRGAQPKQRHIVGGKRQQTADFYRDPVKSGNCSRLDDRASDDIEVFIMAR